MRGFTSPLWPIRYKPLPDELLSCWLLRLAHGHGLKVQTFCNLLFGNRHQVWNRDIDRLAPDWLLSELSIRTGTSIEAVHATTLRAFEGTLFKKFKVTGHLPWVLPVGMYHRKRSSYGQQFCPLCLGTDSTPYFRRTWRLAFVTTCPTHKIMLHDRCHVCGASVNFHRSEMGRGGMSDAIGMAMCHACGEDLCAAPQRPILSLQSDIGEWPSDIAATGPSQFDLDTWNVMHQMAKLLTTQRTQVSLHQYMCDCLGIHGPPTGVERCTIESAHLMHRHHLMQLIGMLMQDLGGWLENAWRSKAVRYNHMLKDLVDPPVEYLKLVSNFQSWRDRL